MKLKLADFLVLTMSLLAAGAAIAYFVSHDWKRGVYWTCIAIVNTITVLLEV